MRLQKIKKVIFVSIAIIMLLLGTYLYERITRCTKKGLTRSEALKLADNKLKIDFQGNDFVRKNNLNPRKQGQVLQFAL